MAAQFVNPYRKSGRTTRTMPRRFVKLSAGKHALCSCKNRRAASGTDVASGSCTGSRGPHCSGQPNPRAPRRIRFGRSPGHSALAAAASSDPRGCGERPTGPSRELLNELLGQLRQGDEQISRYDRQIAHLASLSGAAGRLMAIDGVGPVTATAIIASVGDAKVFANGRQFAAWIGLTPRQHSSGGRSRLGQISKRGDRYLRTLLVHGSRALLRYVARKQDPKSAWAARLMQRRHVNVAAVALAAKQARIIWAMLAKGTEYRAAPIQSVAV